MYQTVGQITPFLKGMFFMSRWFPESTFVRKTPVAYSDGVYKLAGPNRPNARLVSELLFKGQDGLASYLNRTAMMAFFGKQIPH